MDSLGIDDATNVAGIGDLLDLDVDVDIAKIEREIMGDVEEDQGEDDFSEFNKKMEDLEKSIGQELKDEDGEEDDEEPVEDSRFNWQPNSIIEPSHPEGRAPRNTPPRPSRPSDFQQFTEEQKRQRVLKGVLGGEDMAFDMSKEVESDDVVLLLEEIDSLRSILADEDIDISRIPDVDADSPVDVIRNVHKTLRLKNDRNRYCMLAEEMVLAGTSAVEWAFDGKRTYMGRKPDVTGWGAVVGVRLRRMRYDTSTFVSEVMNGFNLGPGSRILLELLPSLILYGKMRKRQTADSLITADEITDAMDTIDRADSKRKN